MNKIHLTINPLSETKVTTSNWSIAGEPERIATRWKDKEYIVVLDKKPFFEIWSVDAEGNIEQFEQRIFPDKQIDELLESVGIRG